jgi:hypothetical protein
VEIVADSDSEEKIPFIRVSAVALVRLREDVAFVAAVMELDARSSQQLQIAKPGPLHDQRTKNRISKLSTGEIEIPADRPPFADPTLVVQSPRELGVVSVLIGAAEEERHLILGLTPVFELSVALVLGCLRRVFVLRGVFRIHRKYHRRSRK